MRRNSHDDMDEQAKDNDAFDSNASNSDLVSSIASDASIAEGENNFDKLDSIKGGFKLDLGASNLNELGIEFVIKFTRVFSAINEVNFGK